MSFSASIHIEVNVQSITFTKSAEADLQDNAHLYMATLTHFSHLVCDNFAGVLRDARRGLTEDYGCEAVRVGTHPCGLTLDVSVARSRLVSFQCDQSSGQLTRDLEKWLVTSKMVGRLGVEEVRLSTEVNSRPS